MSLPSALSQAYRHHRLLILWGETPFALLERPPTNQALQINTWQAEAKTLPEPVYPLGHLPPLTTLSLDPTDRLEQHFAQAGVPLKVITTLADVPAQQGHNLLKLAGHLPTRQGLVLSRGELSCVFQHGDKRHLLTEARRLVEGGALLLLACRPTDDDFRAWWPLVKAALNPGAIFALTDPESTWPAEITPLNLSFAALAEDLQALQPEPLSPETATQSPASEREGNTDHIHIEQETGLAISDKAKVVQQHPQPAGASPGTPSGPPSSAAAQRCRDLQENIREAWDLIKAFEDQRRLSSDPKEKRRAEREIAELRKQLEAYEAEFEALGCEPIEAEDFGSPEPPAETATTPPVTPPDSVSLDRQPIKLSPPPPSSTDRPAKQTSAYEVQADNTGQAAPHALIMKGGGVKGLAYVGALRELEQYYPFNWFVGTSAGAIAAVLLGAGYTVDELETILAEKDFREFLDAKGLKRLTNLMFHGGLYQAETFTRWISDLLAQKLHSPTRVFFKDLPHRVTIYASVRNQRALIFDSHDPACENIEVAHAVRCSMSIPFLFTPQQEQGWDVFDGGVQNNYPVDILLRDHPQTPFIGLYLGLEIYERPPKRSGWLAITELLPIWLEATDEAAIRDYLDQTLIIDPRPIQTTDFSLTGPEKEFLLSAGRTAALKFLAKQNLLNDETLLEAAINQADETRRQVSQVRQAQTKRQWLRLAVIIGVIMGIIAAFLIVTVIPY